MKKHMVDKLSIQYLTSECKYCLSIGDLLRYTWLRNNNETGRRCFIFNIIPNVFVI